MDANNPTKSEHAETEILAHLATEIQRGNCQTAPVKLARRLSLAAILAFAALHYVLVPVSALENHQDTAAGQIFWPLFAVYAILVVGIIVVGSQAPHIWSRRNIKRLPAQVESQALALGRQGGDLLGLLLVQAKPGLGKIVQTTKIGAWVQRQGGLDQVFCRKLLSFEMQTGPFRALIEPLARTRPSFATFDWYLAYVQDEELAWLLPVGGSNSDKHDLAEKIQALDPDTLVTFRLLLDAAFEFGPADQRTNLKALLDATSF